MDVSGADPRARNVGGGSVSRPDRDDIESTDAQPLDAQAPGAPAGADAPAGATGSTGFDLTPRTGPADATGTARRQSSRKRTFAIGGLVLLLAALGFVLFRGLNDAATFFLNVDEAVARQSALQGKRFRMQGNVVPGTVKKGGDGVTFVISYHGAKVPVDHTGTPPELFGPDIPVVIEGTFTGSTFHSDQILIKHDNKYDEKNPDRVKAAQQDAESSAGASGKGAATPTTAATPPEGAGR